MWQAFLEFLKSLFEKLSAPSVPKPVEPKPTPKPPAEVIPFPKTPFSLGTNEWYADAWSRAHIMPEKKSAVVSAVDKLLSHADEYEHAHKAIGCPMWFVGVINHLESGGRMDAVLHNGERIIGTGRKTSLVPRGKGPFNSWHEAAIDALSGYKGIQDWSLPSCLRRLEAYNGLGYVRKGVVSPYLWSFTNVYSKGKYIADGVYDPNAVSGQVGCAAMMKELELRGKLLV